MEPTPIKSEISWDYNQPDFYKFSEDSIFLSREAMKKIKGNMRVLDLACGCGVVGFEIIREAGFEGPVDFLEIQPEYIPYFEANKSHLKAFNANFILGDYSKISLNKKYDLIVSNPPYFSPQNYRKGLDEKKNNCRFFLNGDLESLLSFIWKHLDSNGVGLFLCREFKIPEKYKSIFRFNILKKDGKTSLVEVFPLDIK